MKTKIEAINCVIITKVWKFKWRAIRLWQNFYDPVRQNDGKCYSLTVDLHWHKPGISFKYRFFLKTKSPTEQEVDEMSVLVEIYLIKYF